MRAYSCVVLAVAGLVAVASAEAAEPGFHLIYTSEVRGTVGICG